MTRKIYKRAVNRLDFGRRIGAAATILSACKGKYNKLYPEDPTAQKPDLLFKTDRKTTEINETFSKTAATRVTKGTTKKMNKENYGIKGLANQEVQKLPKLSRLDFRDELPFETSGSGSNSSCSSARLDTSTPSHDAARQFAFSTIEDVTGLKLKNHGKKPLCQTPSDKKSTGKLAYRSVDKDFTTNARAELKIMVVIFTLYHFKDN